MYTIDREICFYEHFLICVCITVVYTLVYTLNTDWDKINFIYYNPSYITR